MSGGDAGSLADGRAEGPGAGAVSRGAGKLPMMVSVAGAVLVADLLTKAWVTSTLALYQSVEVVGDVVRLTYTHNPGAAFGINIGDGSRIFFLVLSVLALGVLVWLYRATPVRDRLRLFAVALATGGALGNIVDRIRYERGVVDFLDVGLGGLRWPVFNVADMAVSIGAVLMVVSIYREERRERAREPGG